MKGNSLGARLYVAMAACAVAMMVSPVLTSSLFQHEKTDAAFERLVLARVEDRLHDLPAAFAAMDEIRREVGIRVTLCTVDGKILHSTFDVARCPTENELDLRPHERDIPRGVRLEQDGVQAVALLKHRPKMNDWAKPLSMILAGSLMIIIASFLLTRSVVRPVDELVGATRALGAGQSGVRVDVQGPAELAALAQSFNEMAARIQAAMETQRSLLSDVGHELRTPLARLRVAVDLALEGDDAQSREMLSDIQTDLAELERIVDDVLQVFRLEVEAEGGVPPLRREQVAIPELMHAAAARFATHHPAQALQLDVDETRALITGDATWMRRAVDNLLDNAARHAESPSVTLRAAVKNGTWRIDVEDEGRGMSEEEQQHLFKPFHRLEKCRTRGKGGVGLGLLLTRRIVEAHGGTLTLTSAPGEGTTATVVLPA